MVQASGWDPAWGKVTQEGQGLSPRLLLGTLLSGFLPGAPDAACPRAGLELPVRTAVPGPCPVGAPGSCQWSWLPATAPLRGTCGSDGQRAQASSGPPPPTPSAPELEPWGASSPHGRSGQEGPPGLGSKAHVPLCRLAHRSPLQAAGGLDTQGVNGGCLGGSAGVTWRARDHDVV